MSQNEQILQHLRAGRPLTPYEALDAFGCFRLAARVEELRRAGHPISVEKVTTGQGKKVAQYRMVTA